MKQLCTVVSLGLLLSVGANASLILNISANASTAFCDNSSPRLESLPVLQPD